MRSVVSEPGDTTSATSSTCSGRVGVTSIVSARYTTTSGRRLVSGTSWSRTSKSVSAFQSGPAASSRALARIRARRLCRFDALGLTTTIPSTTSMPAHWSSDQESYCSAVIRSCIHAGATISALISYPSGRTDAWDSTLAAGWGEGGCGEGEEAGEGGRGGVGGGRGEGVEAEGGEFGGRHVGAGLAAAGGLGDQGGEEGVQVGLGADGVVALVQQRGQVAAVAVLRGQV